jgi:hypothetical protein
LSFESSYQLPSSIKLLAEKLARTLKLIINVRRIPHLKLVIYECCCGKEELARRRSGDGGAWSEKGKAKRWGVKFYGESLLFETENMENPFPPLWLALPTVIIDFPALLLSTQLVLPPSRLKVEVFLSFQPGRNTLSASRGRGEEKKANESFH